MALDGTIQTNDYGKGVYPGAGIARGGQQGRMNMMHNGMGGAFAGGGTQLGASTRSKLPIRPRPTRPTSPRPELRPRPPRPNRPALPGPASWTSPYAAPSEDHLFSLPVTYGGKEGYFNAGNGRIRYIDQWGRVANVGPRAPQGVKLMANPFRNGLWDWKRAQQISSYFAKEAPDPFEKYRDSVYFNQLRGLQRGFDDQVNPLHAEEQSLSARYNGKTLYEQLYEKAQQDFTRGVRDARHEASRSGLLRSGHTDRNLSGLGTQFEAHGRELWNTAGEGRLNALQQARKLAEQQLAEARSGLDLEAAARWLERQQATAAANSGMTIMPKQ